MTEFPLEAKSMQRVYLSYSFYLIGAFLVLPMFVGFVFTVIGKAKSTDSILRIHFEEQLRVFWIYLFSVFGGALVLICLYPIYSAFVIVDRGSREADPEITVLLMLVPALALVLFGYLALMIYVLISSIRGLERPVRLSSRLRCV